MSQRPPTAEPRAEEQKQAGPGLARATGLRIHGAEGLGHYLQIPKGCRH